MSNGSWGAELVKAQGKGACQGNGAVGAGRGAHFVHWRAVQHVLHRLRGAVNLVHTMLWRTGLGYARVGRVGRKRELWKGTFWA